MTDTLGENGMDVRIDMIRKYIFAALLNWKRRDNGAQVKMVYLKRDK